MTGISAQKAALRAQIRGQRSGCNPLEPGFAAQVSALPAWSRARRIAGYLAYGVEPSITDLLRTAISSGVEVLLPVLQPDDLSWAPWNADLGALTAHGNVMQPEGHNDPQLIADADVIIVPALAVDHRGYRLGQGGGSFDRALARASDAAVIVALIYDHEYVDHLPREPHDIPVSVVITPERTIWI